QQAPAYSSFAAGIGPTTQAEHGAPTAEARPRLDQLPELTRQRGDAPRRTCHGPAASLRCADSWIKSHFTSVRCPYIGTAFSSPSRFSLDFGRQANGACAMASPLRKYSTRARG